MINSRVPVPYYPVVNQVNDERWVPPLPDVVKPVCSTTPKCHGCGHYHGSVNVELNCMRAALAQARSDLPVEVREAGEALLKLRKEVSDLQSTLPEGMSLVKGPRFARTRESFSQG